jgi:hypothetical protein
MLSEAQWDVLRRLAAGADLGLDESWYVNDESGMGWVWADTPEEALAAALGEEAQGE